MESPFLPCAYGINTKVYNYIYIYVCVKVFNSMQKYNMHIKKEREAVKGRSAAIRDSMTWIVILFRLCWPMMSKPWSME